MGFKEVYRTLMELFPQVDSRILKAVAIEHPKDAELAVEVVISEIIPNLSKHSAVSSPHSEDCRSNSVSSGGVEDVEQANSLQYHHNGLEKSISSSVESKSTANDDTNRTADAMLESYSSDQGKAHGQTSVLSSCTGFDNNQLLGNSESEELILLVRSQNEEESSNSSTSQAPEVISSSLPGDEFVDPTNTGTNVLCTVDRRQDSNARVEPDRVSQTSLDLEGDGSGGSLTIQCIKLNNFDSSSSHEVDIHGGRNPDVELCWDGMNSKNYIVEEVLTPVEGDIQAEPSCNSSVCQEIKIDFLEDIVNAARDHKTTLFLEVESIMNKMREVELQEKFAEQAKEEAVTAGLETLAKAEQLKQMLAHAKEANDMHAGEVYGEKSILATEVKELQARLLSLSDERDKALAILNEMNEALEARLAVADEVVKAAEKQKLEKEEAARNALSEQEAIMEKVVQESKILQHEAEENSKLREFLVDRGQVVDTLQGEISVICHDVRLLKEKFDERVPLSKLISANQTSCILASSGSSAKSISSDPILQTSMSPNKRRSRANSVNGWSPTNSVKGKSSNFEDNGKKVYSDEDDWDFVE